MLKYWASRNLWNFFITLNWPISHHNIHIVKNSKTFILQSLRTKSFNMDVGWCYYIVSGTWANLRKKHMGRGESKYQDVSGWRVLKMYLERVSMIFIPYILGPLAFATQGIRAVNVYFALHIFYGHFCKNKPKWTAPPYKTHFSLYRLVEFFACSWVRAWYASTQKMGELRSFKRRVSIMLTIWLILTKRDNHVAMYTLPNPLFYLRISKYLQV